MSITQNNLRLSPSLWEGGKRPTHDDLMQLLKRGCMLYSLDIDKMPLGLPLDPVDPSEADKRPTNLLYITCYPGYSDTWEMGYKGAIRNESLVEHIPGQKEYIDQLHKYGIPAIVYQNENNFDMRAFSPDEIKSMEAELDPFSWAFSSVSRRFACYNKPDWRNFLVERLVLRVGETGGDGVFMDNNTPFMHCRCQVCRTKYAQMCGGDLEADMGRPETVVADMRVFDYVGTNQVPKDLVRVDNPVLMRYLEWRVDCIIDFHKELRSRLEERIGWKVLYTANGHVGIAEQSAVYISEAFDMVFSEDGYSAPPVSNAFNVRLGSAMRDWELTPYILTRLTESAPVADMVKVLSAEGRALGGQGEFWDYHIRCDKQLAAAQKEIREFYIGQADKLFSVERDRNDIAVVYSWRSDLWTSQAISLAKMFGGLLEDMNMPYDVLIAERDSHADRLAQYKLVIVPNAEILSEYWYNAVKTYLDGNGHVISTGTTGLMDEHINPRKVGWEGPGYIHFEGMPEKEYYNSRRMINMHVCFQRPVNPLTDAIEKFVSKPTLTTSEALAVITLNHTALPDGEAFHVVNRYVNIFPHIHATPRENLTLVIRPDKKPSRIEWISPDNPGLELRTIEKDDTLHVTIPELVIYGIVRVYY